MQPEFDGSTPVPQFDVVVVEPVDLTAWIAQSYQAVAGFPAGVWTVAGGGLSVFQSQNGQPTMFYSDFSAFGTQVQGKIMVTGADDDFVGFALGYQPGDPTNASADYLLIDWKRGTQYYNFSTPSCGLGSTAPAGLAVSRVTGVPIADEFWGHSDQDVSCSPSGDGLQELARATNLGSTGWQHGTEYVFGFEFNSTSLKVYVDDVLEIDITGTFGNGRLAFYNFSQAGVTYSGFEVTPLIIDVAIDIKPGSDPNCFNIDGHGVVPVAILGSEDFDVTGIDPATVQLAGLPVAVRGKNAKLLAHVEDVSGPDGIPDGFDDLVLQMADVDGAFTGANGTAILTGSLYDGTEIVGSDDVCLSSPDSDGDDVRDAEDCDPTVPNAGTYDGHTYMVCQGQKNFEAANAACTESGFDLAYIDTEEENTWVVDLAVGIYGLEPFEPNVSELTTYWIANLKADTPTLWPSNNPIWAGGEPSGDGDYIHLIRYYEQPYGWNDVPPSWTWGWVCESP
jgi:hypothetical protein